MLLKSSFIDPVGELDISLLRSSCTCKLSTALGSRFRGLEQVHSTFKNIRKLLQETDIHRSGGTWFRVSSINHKLEVGQVCKYE